MGVRKGMYQVNLRAVSIRFALKYLSIEYRLVFMVSTVAFVDFVCFFL
jgi:hypothetical protein